MRPRKIIVMRHAESEEDIDKTIYAHTADLDIGLSINGRNQALDVGPKLASSFLGRTVHFYISPGLRLRQTFELASTNFFKSILCTHSFEKMLLKQFWGDVTVENRREIEIARYKQGVLFYRFPNGESGYELIERFRLFINRLQQGFHRHDSPENVVILTHGFEMRIFLMVWFDWSVPFFERLANPRNCEIAELTPGTDHLYNLKDPLRLYNPLDNPLHVSRV